VDLYRIDAAADELIAPTLVAAFDSWIDAGSAATTAAGRLAEGGEVIARFEADLLFDYRARRPTLEIVDGRPTELTWPELMITRRRVGERDLLVLVGPEPDYCWQELAENAAELARRLGVLEWISLGAIPSAVPHTRPVSVLGTESEAGLLRGDVHAGPVGRLRVPAACISVLDYAVSRAGVPTVGYYAQIPHYVSGEYPAAAIALLRSVALHLDLAPDYGPLEEEARQLRVRLDTAAAVDETTRTYVERLESMVDEARLPSGDDLISEIERFLRRGGTEEGQRS